MKFCSLRWLWLALEPAVLEELEGSSKKSAGRNLGHVLANLQDATICLTAVKAPGSAPYTI